MSLNFNEIKLDIGESIQLQDADDREGERIFVKLMGYRKDKSILVTTPMIDGKEVSVFKGQKFIARLFSVKTVYAFNVVVVESKRTPYPYMHLSYPLKVESVVVRAAQRVNVELLAAVKNEDPDKHADDSIAAKLCDLSTGGAKLIAHEPVGDSGDNISLAVKLVVGGIEQYIQILATIRRVDLEKAEDKNDQDAYVYGLEFCFVDEKERLVLHGFVYEKLSEG